MQTDADIHERLSGCVFCYPLPSLQLLRTQNFGVMLDLAPLVEGHVTVYPRWHWGCCGEIPAWAMSEFITLKKTVEMMLEATYGRVSFFEHGRAGHCLHRGVSDRLCHHLHCHALPVTVNPSEELSSRFRAISVTGLGELPALYDAYGEYLFFEDARRAATFFPVHGEIEPHLLRTLVARGLRAPERADWSSFRDPAAVSTGAAKLRSYLEAHRRQLAGEVVVPAEAISEQAP